LEQIRKRKALLYTDLIYTDKEKKMCTLYTRPMHIEPRPYTSEFSVVAIVASCGCELSLSLRGCPLGSAH